MATTTQYIFPAANTQDVCLIQNTTGPLNLVLNGNLVVVKGTRQVPFISYGYSRNISFTSTNNLSTATFTIFGTQNGVNITETIAGPNNNTVYSTKIYDVITNISVDSAITAIQVGSGHSGYFAVIPVDISTAPINYTFSLASLASTNQIATIVYSTLQNIVNNGSTITDIISGNIGTLFTVKTSSAANLYIYPVAPATQSALYHSLLIQLIGSSTTIGNGIILTFIEL